MPTLHIALQEGFSNDDVVVRVNGHEILRKSGITTRPQIGYADSIERELPPGRVTVEVSVTSRNTSSSEVIELTQPTYLGVSLDAAGAPTYRTSLTPFGYL
jgi:hypothetical protein